MSALRLVTTLTIEVAEVMEDDTMRTMTEALVAATECAIVDVSDLRLVTTLVVVTEFAMLLVYALGFTETAMAVTIEPIVEEMVRMLLTTRRAADV